MSQIFKILGAAVFSSVATVAAISFSNARSEVEETEVKSSILPDTISEDEAEYSPQQAFDICNPSKDIAAAIMRRRMRDDDFSKEIKKSENFPPSAKLIYDDLVIKAFKYQKDRDPSSWSMHADNFAQDAFNACMETLRPTLN